MLRGKVRKIKVWKLPSFDKWKRTLVASRWPDCEVRFTATPTEQWGAYRLDNRFFLVKRSSTCVEIATLLEGVLLSHNKFYEEEAQGIYRRWKECSLPCLCRYFGDERVITKA